MIYRKTETLGDRDKERLGDRKTARLDSEAEGQGVFKTGDSKTEKKGELYQFPLVEPGPQRPCWQAVRDRVILES